MKSNFRFRVGIFDASRPALLLACLLLGAIDTTGRYLAPEYGEFFFYLAVIVIITLFPRGLLGRAK